MRIEIELTGILADIAGERFCFLDFADHSEFPEKKINSIFPDFQNINYKIFVNQKGVESPVLFNEGDKILCMPLFSGG